MYSKSKSAHAAEDRIEAARSRIINPITAIKAKCTDCTGSETNAVRDCEFLDCPLYPYRFGKNVFRGKPKPENYLPPMKSIRAECISCNYTPKEVQLCPCTECALYPLRLGINVYASDKRRKVGQESILKLKKPPCDEEFEDNSIDACHG